MVANLGTRIAGGFSLLAGLVNLVIHVIQPASTVVLVASIFCMVVGLHLLRAGVALREQGLVSWSISPIATKLLWVEVDDFEKRGFGVYARLKDGHSVNLQYYGVASESGMHLIRQLRKAQSEAIRRGDNFDSSK